MTSYLISFSLSLIAGLGLTVLGLFIHEAAHAVAALGLGALNVHLVVGVGPKVTVFNGTRWSLRMGLLPLYGSCEYNFDSPNSAHALARFIRGVYLAGPAVHAIWCAMLGVCLWRYGETSALLVPLGIGALGVIQSWRLTAKLPQNDRAHFEWARQVLRQPDCKLDASQP